MVQENWEIDMRKMTSRTKYGLSPNTYKHRCTIGIAKAVIPELSSRSSARSVEFASALAFGLFFNLLLLGFGFPVF
jgi:hypothetical protein